MTALVCRKRSFFEDELITSPHPSFKKHRCSRYISPFTPNKNTLLDSLKQTFPLLDEQILDQTLRDCDLDMDLAIRKLHELRLVSPENNPVQEEELQQQPSVNTENNNVYVLSGHDIKWVELFVQEMSRAGNLDDAKARATRALVARNQEVDAATAELKEKNQKVMMENSVLKRLVVAQHERMKKIEKSCAEEVEQLKRVLVQGGEQFKSLEMSNYALRMRLNQYQPSHNMFSANNLPPDVY